MADSSNTTQSTSRRFHVDILLTSGDKAAVVVLSTLIFIVGFTGNSLVLYIFGYKRRGKQKTSELLFSLLAATDLLTSVMLPILLIYRYIWSGSSEDSYQVVCIIMETISSFNITMSQVILILICLERYQGITSPLSAPGISLRSIVISLAAGIFVSICVMIPFWMDFSSYCSVLYSLQLNREIEPDIPPHFMIFGSLAFIRDILSLTVMSVYIVRMVRALRVSESSIEVGKRLDRAKKFRKARKLLIVVIAVFMICILPDSMAYIIIKATILATSPVTPKRIMDIVRVTCFLRILLSANSIANPIIYTFMHPLMIWHRSKIKSCIMRCFRRKRHGSEIPMELEAPRSPKVNVGFHSSDV